MSDLDLYDYIDEPEWIAMRDRRFDGIRISEQRILRDEEIRKSEAERNKKPYWQLKQEEGDYLPEDSGMGIWDNE